MTEPCLSLPGSREGVVVISEAATTRPETRPRRSLCKGRRWVSVATGTATEEQSVVLATCRPLTLSVPHPCGSEVPPGSLSLPGHPVVGNPA